MRIDTIISSFTSNTYIVHVDNKAYIIDPSVNVDIIKGFIKKEEVGGIIVTHGHIDHIYYLNECTDYFNAKVYGNYNLKEIAEDNSKNFACEMGIDKKISLSDKNFVKVKDKDIIDNLFEVIYTPGHSVDSISVKIEDKLFTGDTLFDGNIGRWDLYKGSFEDLSLSIKRLFTLGDLFIYPGHGDSSNLKVQILKNYYVRKILKDD